MIFGTALAVIGGFLLLIGLLALLGLSSIIPGDLVAGGIQGVFTVFLNWWQVWLPIALIGLVAFIARGGRGSGGDSSIVDTAVGLAEGRSRAMADGGEPESNPITNPEPSVNQEFTDSSDGILSENDGPQTSYKNRQNEANTMTEASEKAEERMKEIINDIESDEKTERHVIELQENAKQELKDALKRFHKHKDEINVLRQLGEAQGGQFTVSELMQNLDQIEKKTGTDFRDQDAIRALVRNLEHVEKELKDAHKKIKEADHDLEQVESVDMEIDKHMKVLEEEELKWTKEAKQTVENLNGRLQWSG